MTMRITLLIEPSGERRLPLAAGTERYSRLAEELGLYAGVRVPVLRDSLKDVPDDGYILLASSVPLSESLAACASKQVAQLKSRIVLLDISWQRALAELEHYRLAGVIDSLRMSEWLARPSSCRGPFGLRYVANLVGARCSAAPWFRSEHYCLLESEQHRGMPHLLADYLAAYDRDQQLLSTLPSVSLTRVRPVLAEGPRAKPQIGSGPEERTVRADQVESVSIKRVVDSLRRSRETAHMTLSQVAERSGFDADQLALLEGNDYRRATLGTLRAYFLALEPHWGLTLVETACPSLRQEQKPGEKGQTARKADQPIVVSGIGPKAIADVPESSPPTAEVPRVFIDRGMTFLGNPRIRRREPEEALYNPCTSTRKEKSNAGV